MTEHNEVDGAIDGAMSKSLTLVELKKFLTEREILIKKGWKKDNLIKIHDLILLKEKYISSLEEKKPINLNLKKNREGIMYIEIIHYYEEIPEDARLYSILVKEDFGKEIVKFWGIPYSEKFDKKLYEKAMDVREVKVKFFKRFYYCEDLIDVLPFDDYFVFGDTTLDLRMYGGLMKNNHGRSVLVK